MFGGSGLPGYTPEDLPRVITVAETKMPDPVFVLKFRPPSGRRLRGYRLRLDAEHAWRYSFVVHALHIFHREGTALLNNIDLAQRFWETEQAPSSPVSPTAAVGRAV